MMTAYGQGFSRSISGRVVFEGASTSCHMIPIELESPTRQRLQVAYLDSACGFEFRTVSPGQYLIHLAIDGFSEVRHPLDFNGGASSSIAVFTSPLPPKPVTAVSPARAYTISASKLLEGSDEAQELFGRAMESIKRGRTDDAMRQLLACTAISPEFFDAHNELGLLYLRKGHLGEAEREFLRAREIDSSNPQVLVNLAGVYLEKDDFESAIRISEEAVKRDGASAAAFLGLGVALYGDARFDGAEIALKKALELDPEMFQARLALANVYMKMRRADLLLAQLNAYLDENPDGASRTEATSLRDKILRTNRIEPE
jgi:tetratricopeptide (TPR) repeat protein